MIVIISTHYLASNGGLKEKKIVQRGSLKEKNAMAVSWSQFDPGKRHILGYFPLQKKYSHTLNSPFHSTSATESDYILQVTLAKQNTASVPVAYI